MRESAIATHLEQGMKKSEVCTIFKIQRCTLDSHKKKLDVCRRRQKAQERFARQIKGRFTVRAGRRMAGASTDSGRTKGRGGL